MTLTTEAFPDNDCESTIIFKFFQGSCPEPKLPDSHDESSNPGWRQAAPISEDGTQALAAAVGATKVLTLPVMT
jgi:hypothetical protein